MRKIALLLTALTMTAAAVSCGGKTSSSSSSSSQEESVPEETAEEVTEAPLIIDPDGNILKEKPTETTRAIVSSDDFEYELKDTGAVVTRYKGEAADVVVPYELGGAPVTEIGFYSFEAQYDIHSVTLPETVTLICEGAFMDCASMESINLPEGLTGIERGAFVACTSLKALTLPSSCTSVAEEAFTACESMTELTINNPDLAYENWGLEELPGLRITAPEGSAVQAWAQGMGKA